MHKLRDLIYAVNLPGREGVCLTIGGGRTSWTCGVRAAGHVSYPTYPLVLEPAAAAAAAAAAGMEKGREGRREEKPCKHAQANLYLQNTRFTYSNMGEIRKHEERKTFYLMWYNIRSFFSKLFYSLHIAQTWLRL